MNQRQAILWRVITANARKIAPNVPTVARVALVATTLPELPAKATTRAPVVDYDTATAEQWNAWVMRGV